jgi:hypothetical protein
VANSLRQHQPSPHVAQIIGDHTQPQHRIKTWNRLGLCHELAIRRGQGRFTIYRLFKSARTENKILTSSPGQENHQNRPHRDELALVNPRAERDPHIEPSLRKMSHCKLESRQARVGGNQVEAEIPEASPHLKSFRAGLPGNVGARPRSYYLALAPSRLDNGVTT